MNSNKKMLIHITSNHKIAILINQIIWALWKLNKKIISNNNNNNSNKCSKMMNNLSFKNNYFYNIQHNKSNQSNVKFKIKIMMKKKKKKKSKFKIIAINKIFINMTKLKQSKL